MAPWNHEHRPARSASYRWSAHDKAQATSPNDGGGDSTPTDYESSPHWVSGDGGACVCLAHLRERRGRYNERTERRSTSFTSACRTSPWLGSTSVACTHDVLQTCGTLTATNPSDARVLGATTSNEIDHYVRQQRQRRHHHRPTVRKARRHESVSPLGRGQGDDDSAPSPEGAPTIH